MTGNNIAQDVLDAQRLERAIRLRVRGAHWSEIAAACDYPSAAAALADVGRAMAAAGQRAAETAETMRDTANLRLEHLLSATLDMLDEEASVNYDQDGNQLVADDRAVKLRAVDEARRIVESITKLNGVAVPDKTDDGKGERLRVEIVGIRPEDIV